MKWYNDWRRVRGNGYQNGYRNLFNGASGGEWDRKGELRTGDREVVIRKELCSNQDGTVVFSDNDQPQLPTQLHIRVTTPIWAATGV